MLLTRRGSLRRHPLYADDTGFVLAGVLGLLLLVLLLSAIVTASVLNGLSATASSRAVVQSQSAAEAGVDIVRAVLVTGGRCSTTMVGTSPTFSAEVSYATAVTVPGVLSSAWIKGCPTAIATWVRVVSVGTPQSVNPLNDRATVARAVEAIFSRGVGSPFFTFYSSRNVVTK